MKSNKLIAEFMELETPDGCYFEYITKEGERSKLTHFILLEYHLSWSWLMPVVRKIDNTITLSSKDESYLYCFDMVSENHVTIFDSLTSTTIVKVPFDKAYEREPVYKAVVKFIEWYNKKQN
jgi:hypothetical protein